MKRIIVFVALLAVVYVATAQGISPYSVRNIRFGFEFNSDIWLNKPDTLDLKNINRGINLTLLYHHRFGKSNFGIAGGLSISSQNMYLKNAVLSTNSDGISEFKIAPSNANIQKSKLNLTFVEVPVEFTFKTKKHLNFAIGAKAGYLFGDKTKYKGSDFENSSATDIKKKVSKNENILNYRLGAYALIGYKWINLTAYYGLTNLFEDGKGPEMSPLTIGILVRPY